jgi:phosphopantothenoylcysteine decarboxylase/phosphopantothenate--cysteine ligase
VSANQDLPASGRTVVVGVGGGIAAYKACELVRRLRDHGLRVRVAMTRNAQQFVGPLTFQALSGEPPLTDLMDPRQDATYGHLDFGRSADLVMIAPATADLIARIQAGLADDPVTAVVLARHAPLLLCPAMNTAMWENRRVQANIAALRAEPGVAICGPAEGQLADGDVGMGRLAEVPDILAAALRLLSPKDLQGVGVLVTAGPTREPLDPVRFLSNPSSGRMGFALAEAAQRRGAEVTLVTGPVELPPPGGVKTVRVDTAQQMAEAALKELPGKALIVAAAAVSDFRPKKPTPQKKKKGDATAETLELERTPDVLASLRSAAGDGRKRPIFIGFAAETELLEGYAREKLRGKKLDLIVANLVGQPGTGFASEFDQAVLFSPTGPSEELPRLRKSELADRILDRAVALLPKR